MATDKIDPNWASGYDDRYDYRVDIKRRRNPVTVTTAEGVRLAHSERTLLVDEQNHGIVFYFPQNAVEMTKLVKIDKVSHCPFKGVASYWALAQGDHTVPVAWSYENPYPEVSQIAGYLGFYADQVTVSIGAAIFPIPKNAKV
jgi:uncharacterized protein (DUF427 family)